LLQTRAPHPLQTAGEASSLYVSKMLTRVTGVESVQGNAVVVLKDGTENYPAWLDAIRSAQNHILLESYMIRNDSEGERFADALIGQIQKGVRVYVIYDWIGMFPRISSGLWRKLRKAGAEVRCFNPPTLTSPLVWLTRDHRKALVVDNEIAFVSGLCIGCDWSGNQSKGIDPWRDSGVQVRGPATADIAHAFARAWAHTGDPLPEEILNFRSKSDQQFPENVSVRVLATEPENGQMFRVDQLLAAAARSRIWISDAYFTGATFYVQALISAAQEGVDVRLLLPGSSDISVLSPISRVGYRPLLEGGVHIYEWNGPMMHAKTAVIDGRWSRIGSTNLNSASWTGNWELDVLIEDHSIGEKMEALFLEDLKHSTEIIVEDRRVVRKPLDGPPQMQRRRRRATPRRVVARAVTLGYAFDSALANRRELDGTEARALLTASFALLGLAVALWFAPKVFALPFAVLLAWISLGLVARVVRLFRHEKSQAAAQTKKQTRPADVPSTQP